MDFNHIFNHISDLSTEGDFLELGTWWGENSTDILAQLADQLQRQLYTIDFDPDCTRQASERHKHKSWVHCVNDRAEHWLQQHQHLRFSLVLLDNYDWINQPDLPQQPQWQQQQTQRYQQLGEQQQNLISQARHLQQVQLVLPLLTPRAVIVLDDTHWRERDHDYTGKGGACVPLLLDHGWQLHRYQYGVIMTRQPDIEVQQPLIFNNLSIKIMAPYGVNDITNSILKGTQIQLISPSTLPPQSFVCDINTDFCDLRNFTQLLQDPQTAQQHLLSTEHVPRKVLDRLRAGTAKVMVNLATEACIDHSLLDQLYKYLEAMKVPASSLIYVTNAWDGHNIVAEHAELRGHKVSIEHYYYPFFLIDHRTRYDPDWTQAPRPWPPQRIFLCFNYKHHSHRLFFYMMMHEMDLIKHCYYSLPQYSYKGDFAQAMDQYLSHDHEQFRDDFSHDSIKQADEQLPLVLEPNFQQHMQDSSPLAPELYRNSMISVVVETNFFRLGVHITEKTYKPISFRHPFVILANPGHLQALHSMGFETFSEFWDESYDLIQDHRQRMKAVVSVLEGISRWSTEQQQQFRDRVEKTLVKNQQLLAKLSTSSHFLQQFIQLYGV